MPTFPGVYAQVIDKSFVNGLQSRFTCGLVGVASRGPLNQAVQVRSLQDFVSNFGQSVDGSYLAQAVASVTGAGGDGARVVRVATTFAPTTAVGSGAQGGYSVYTSSTAVVNTGDYVTVKQAGKVSTVNARIQSISTGTLTLVSAGAEAVSLADTYTSAAISRSTASGSANKAEALLTAPTYNPALTLAGNVVGNKSDYSFTVAGDASQVTVGSVIKITQAGRASTREVKVQAVNVLTKTVTLIPVTDTETGQQALPLQDNYTTGTIYVMQSQTGSIGAQLNAATEGTWANTVGNTVGLRVTVSPGSKPDTKKLLVYLDGALVETQDNLSFDSTSTDYWITRLAGDSYVTVLGLFGTEPPGNTLNPWNTAVYSASNVATFTGGFDGANVAASDYVGTINPADDSATGLQVYNDKETFDSLFALAVPGVSDAAVVQMLGLVANTLNAIALVDIPDNINAREAIDWTNAQGLYANLQRIDNARVAFFWNWFETVNPFTGNEEFVPPTVGALGLMSLTFDRYKPWYAAAGEQRGQLPNAAAVRYPRVRDDVKQAMYGDGNVVNPILLYRGTSILLYGNLTSQRTESFMQEISVMHLVNYILKNLSRIGRKYIFDPNDSVLLSQLTLDGTAFMDTVRSERGVETFELVCNSSNNTAAVRNAKSAIIDLAIIPIGALEKLFINLTVNESGATLNAITSGPTGSN